MPPDRGIPLLKAIVVAAFLCWTGFGQVIISEFMASNSQTLADEDGDYSDWIELLNIGTTNLDLNGWALTDNPDNPRHWKFPPTLITPGQNLVVFASGKDRRVPGSPLHTDFKLSAKGGFLGLADPLGNIVFSFGTNYPSQLPDVSFGVVVEEQSVTLSEGNAPLKYFVPMDSSVDEFWRALEFDDSAWSNGTSGIGFDQNPPSTNTWTDAVLSRNPLLYFKFEETTGTVAANLGSLGSTQNGTYIAGILLNQVSIRPPEAEGMSDANLTVRFDGKDDYVTTSKSSLDNLGAFTMAAWIRPSTLSRSRVGLWGQHDAIEFGFIDDTVLQVSTANGGVVQADYPFAANEWHFVAITGDGETLRIYLDAILVAEGGNATGNYGASLYPFVIGGNGIFDASQNWFTGNIDEFALYSRALSADELFLQFLVAKDPFVSFRDIITSDVSADMFGINSSIYFRNAFISDSSDYDRLLLHIRYDDGFVAALNGIIVAQGNVPGEVTWNSAALQDRPGVAGLREDEFDISADKGLLLEGANVLAIQALNSANNDDDLFLQTELVGIRRSVQTNAWRYFLQPTPGVLNGPGDINIGPLIVDVIQTPELPADSDSITVRARMIRTVNPPTDLTLTYRVMFGAETAVTMRDDGSQDDGLAGDGIYGAIIPASAASSGQMVRWHLRATDNQGNTTRWPPYRDTRNSPQYLGTMISNPALTNPLPVLHWFIQNASAADTSSGTRSSVFWDGVLYDNIFVNIHGQSSLSFPKKSYNLDFNTGYHFAYSKSGVPVEDINLLTTYPDKAHVRNVLAYETFRDAGHPYHFVVPVRVQRNGVFFSDAHMVEDGDADYLARVGLDPHGALYKMYNALDSSTTGAEKKTRKFENNTDLQKLISGLSLSGTAKTAFVYDNVDIPAMVNYLAAMIITGNVDCCHKNYYLYRDSEGNGEWQFLPWDVDLSFGRNWIQSKTYYDDTMNYNNGLYVGSGNRLPDALFANTAIKQMYLRRLRTLMDQLLQPSSTPSSQLHYEMRLVELYKQIGPDASLDFAKWPTWGTPQTMPEALNILTTNYMPRRRNFLYAQTSIPAAITNDLTINFGSFDFNPASGLQTQEYVAIVNPNNVAVDVSGWTIEGGIQHTFRPGTVLPINGTLYLSPDVNAFRRRDATPRGGQGLFVQGNYKGQLSARGDLLILRDSNGRVVNSMNYAGQPTPAQQFLRVTEIMYAPGGPAISGATREELEYLVLKNTGGTSLDISGAQFNTGITFTFSDATVLAPGQSIYLAKNPEAFSSYYGTNFLIAGPYLGQLANEGERLELYDAVGEKILDFSYNNQWYPLTESQGFSLVASDESANYASWGEKSNWVVSAFSGGSASIDAAWNNFRLTHFSESELDDMNASGSVADPDLDGLSNYDEFLVGTDPRDGQSNLQFELVNVGAGNVALRFFSVAGRTYSVWAADELVSTEWSQTGTSTRANTSGKMELQMSVPQGTKSEYFKLRVTL